MRAVVMKVGTMPVYIYSVRETKLMAGTCLSPGQRIIFREQQHGSKWQRGRITGMSGDMPLVELE